MCYYVIIFTKDRRQKYTPIFSGFDFQNGRLKKAFVFWNEKRIDE